jgi:hypothetical protein
MPGGKIPRAKNKERSLVASLRRDDNLRQAFLAVIPGEAKNVSPSLAFATMNPSGFRERRKRDSSRKSRAQNNGVSLPDEKYRPNDPQSATPMPSDFALASTISRTWRLGAASVSRVVGSGPFTV